MIAGSGRAKIVVVCATISACSLFVDTSGLNDESGGGSDGSTVGSDGNVTSGDSGTSFDDASTDIPGLLAYWKFDEGSGDTATDESSYGYVAKLNSGATWATGHEGSAVSFDGVKGRAFVDDAPGLSPGSPVTIAFWIDADDLPDADERLIDMGYVWDVKLNGPSEIVQLSFSDVDGASGYVSMENGLPMSDWHHLTFTFDSIAGVVWYVDGKLQTYDSNVFPLGSVLKKDQSGFSIGSDTDDHRTCKCKIDDMRIYTRALTGAEVATIAKL